jgi:hypothetical protein
MSFEQEPQLWKMRPKHGRDHLFKTPETLWEAACGYFQWCDEHSVFQMVRGPSSQPVMGMPRVRAYTLQGLCVYLGCGSKYFNHFEAQRAGKTDEVSEEFMRIISLIRDVIFEQKFTAAAAGELNPGIIARELNLTYNNDGVAKAKKKDDDDDKPEKFIVWGDQEIPI